jgi:hypothetical protein
MSLADLGHMRKSRGIDIPFTLSTQGTDWEDIDAQALWYFFGDIFFTRVVGPAAEDKAASAAWQSMDRGSVDSEQFMSFAFCLWISVANFA